MGEAKQVAYPDPPKWSEARQTYTGGCIDLSPLFMANLSGTSSAPASLGMWLPQGTRPRQESSDFDWDPKANPPDIAADQPVWVHSDDSDFDFDWEPKVNACDAFADQAGCCQSDDDSCNVRSGSDDGERSRCPSETYPVRATFIHFDTPSNLAEEPAPQMLRRSTSAPSIMTTAPFITAQSFVQEAHYRGDCKPCAYFLLKKDGCRWGADCEFCHICPAGELKKRKKEKAKALKLEEQKLRPKRNPAWFYGRRPPWWNRKSTGKA